MSVFVCIPTANDIHSMTAAAVFRICANHAGGAEFQTIAAQPADFSRNLCVRKFLDSQHSHMFFVDSDVVPPDECLDLMLASRRPIVCGVYPLLLGQKSIHTSVARRNAEGQYEFVVELGDQPFDVDAGGMGCCLIERSVLERMEPPWFRFVQNSDCSLIGEDIFFFERAARLGIRPLVIPQVQCSHFKTVDLLEVIRTVWRARSPQLQPAGV